MRNDQYYGEKLWCKSLNSNLVNSTSFFTRKCSSHGSAVAQKWLATGKSLCYCRIHEITLLYLGGTKSFLFRFCFGSRFQEKTETETKQWPIRMIWLCFGFVSVLFRFCFGSVSVLFRFCFSSVSVRFQSGFSFLCGQRFLVSFQFRFCFQNRNTLVIFNKIG